MRFILNLHTILKNAVLPVNYQYPLSAAIYKIISQADAVYAGFLHEEGYHQENSLKAFKLFTFSDLKTPFKMEGDRMRLREPEAQVLISFHLPRAAETFIKGLFLSQEIEIADKKSWTKFKITRVESVPSGLSEETFQEILLRPISPLVCGQKKNNGDYQFLSPDHPEFTHQLMYNWKEKYKTVYGTENANAVFVKAGMEVIFYKNAPKSRLITIKAGTPAETKIRGFLNFRLKGWGNRKMLELLLNAGTGVYNAMGFGCMEIVAKNKTDNVKNGFQ